MEEAFQQTKINDGKWFDVTVYVIAAILFVIVLYPILFVISASFSDPLAVISGNMVLWPVGFTLKAYTEVFHNQDVWIGYRNTLFYATLGTVINLIMTTAAAYPLSRRDLPGRNIIMFAITFTMFFQGGLIPTFLIVKDLHMVNTFWALILPAAITTYNLIVMRTYFQTNIPWEMQEAAMIDGCSNIRLLWHIILPLSKPIMAVMVLFYAVFHWNAYFNALIYLRDRDLYPLQLVLREILISNQNALMGDSTSLVDSLMLAETMKYALIMIASIPVLVLYPFAQKHFVKGVMIGSVKG
jgi:putative aldouronate transport system permease protein